MRSWIFVVFPQDYNTIYTQNANIQATYPYNFLDLCLEQCYPLKFTAYENHLIMQKRKVVDRDGLG